MKCGNGTECGSTMRFHFIMLTYTKIISLQIRIFISCRGKGLFFFHFAHSTIQNIFCHSFLVNGSPIVQHMANGWCTIYKSHVVLISLHRCTKAAIRSLNSCYTFNDRFPIQSTQIVAQRDQNRDSRISHCQMAPFVLFGATIFVGIYQINGRRSLKTATLVFRWRMRYNLMAIDPITNFLSFLIW